MRERPGTWTSKPPAIVTAGHRALALRNHPDAGGKPDVMRRLNTARAWLEATVRNALGDGR